MAGRAHNFETLGDIEYRLGARQRLDEAVTLLRDGQFAGSIYLAGRSVEGMLRATIWKSDPEYRQGKKSPEAGHDFRQLLTQVRRLGLLRTGGRDDDFERTVEMVGRLWFNNMRFAANALVERRFRRLGAIDRRQTFKQVATGFYLACATIFKRCEAAWQL
jgi:hypothetical protein